MSLEPFPSAGATLAPPLTAGAMLRAARESHGLSIDTIAQHLKLATRQVIAIEADDFAALPGRTFVRGFARNYARLMQIDSDAVVAALPDGLTTPTLDKAAIASSGRSPAELPYEHASQRASWSRWAIPLAIVALIVVAVVYATTRGGGVLPSVGTAASTKAKAPDPIEPPAGVSTQLANPLMTSPATPQPLPTEPAPPAAQTSVAASTPQTTAPAVADATLTIRYRGSAWTEVRDANDQRVFLGTGVAGTTQTVTGTPPLDLTLGNASLTSITWRGAPVDLEPYSKGNVARVRLL
ncbi:MAG TPA: RodZ domain-containing protein [Casimicrobiaceae bacterium]|nr:RodZ domain-containing protein [Casimicrobiaceae bacterium]